MRSTTRPFISTNVVMLSQASRLLPSLNACAREIPSTSYVAFCAMVG